MLIEQIQTNRYGVQEFICVKCEFKEGAGFWIDIISDHLWSFTEISCIIYIRIDQYDVKNFI